MKSKAQYSERFHSYLRTFFVKSAIFVVVYYVSHNIWSEEGTMVQKVYEMFIT